MKFFFDILCLTGFLPLGDGIRYIPYEGKHLVSTMANQLGFYRLAISGEL